MATQGKATGYVGDPDMDRMVEVLRGCSNILPSYRPWRTMKQVFSELADSVEDDESLDVYGSGDGLAGFEAEMAALFGKEAAVFMPSGTMAQQIALRIWCEKRRNFTVVMHPLAHLEVAEHAGYQALHGIRRLQFGAPELVRDRMLTVEDLDRLGQEAGAILLELPYRPLGAQLPPWEDLVAMKAWAGEHGVPMHLDGARIWQCRRFYGKEYAEIGGCFDSLYVSFYKDLGGLCGAMLMGPKRFIEEARVWQIRHGGRLRTQGPFWASARQGVRRVLPQIDSWVDKTREVAAVLSRYEKIAVLPHPPHVNMFQLYIRGEPETLNHRHLDLAEETGTFLFFGLEAALIPGYSQTEMTLGENSMRFEMDKLSPFLERLLE